MAVRSVENLVKKYASRVTTLKKITPHKLRSTYGTELYKETGDIYLVADVLGHKDVNTTRKHYAALEEQRRRQDSELISVYYGCDVAEDAAEALRADLEEAYPACDIELQYGGQPIYYYTVSVE